MIRKGMRGACAVAGAGTPRYRAPRIPSLALLSLLFTCDLRSILVARFEFEETASRHTPGAGYKPIYLTFLILEYLYLFLFN